VDPDDPPPDDSRAPRLLGTEASVPGLPGPHALSLAR